MNEVTKIHLARQAFTISVDAYHELRTYIEAITKQVKDKDVVNEIELRMSELLLERGVNSNKVVLPADVDYLKEQLGSPSDFTDDSSEPGNSLTENKRLFRDTDNAMIAGVAAGLAKYFGIDTLLARILFVILVIITAGWGILLYILLWLLVPEAKTSSERLQMAGKPVTAKSLKEVVDQADVKGAANRMNNALAGPVNSIFNVFLKTVGVFFVALGLSGLFGLIAAETYFVARGTAWTSNNIFPIGFRQHLLLDIALAVAALLTIFVILFGIAIFRRKWPIKAWITGVLVGLTFIGLAVGGALTADVYPDVRNAYLANQHSTVRSFKSFSGLDLVNAKFGDINFVPSDKYMVVFNYYDHPDINAIKTSIDKNGTLLIDASNFNPHRNCSTICLPADYQLSITIYSPNALQLESQTMPMPPKPFIMQAEPVPYPITN